MENALRTQILLPKKLRGEGEKARRVTGESLAEYLRKAAMDRIEREKKSAVDLTALARKIGTVKKSGWDDLDVIEWQRQMREDRDI